MKISIIIPCYNIAEHLSKCIESVLAQTYQDFELLLINDGSTDATLQIAKEYAKKDQRIKVFSHENQGVSFTRNRGIDESKGKLVLFIDGDDYVKPDYVERLKENYTHGSWPICGMVNVKNGVPTENSNYKGLLDKYPIMSIHKKNFMDVLAFYSLSSPCARIYSKEIISENDIKFPVDVTYQEDLLFNLEYIKHIKQVLLNDYFGYFYVEHSVSSTGRFHENFKHISILNKNLRPYVQDEEDELILKEFLFQTVLRKIANVFNNNSTKSKKHINNELKQMFNSDYYATIYNYINKTEINFILKRILRLKSPKLLSLYFKIKN